MNNIDIVTRKFNVNGSGNKFCKIITLKKYYLNKVVWHDNQVKFKVLNANSYDGLDEKEFFIGIYEDTSNIDKISFQDFSPHIQNIECVYVKNGDSIDIYIKGSGLSSNICVLIEYTLIPGFLTLHQSGDFLTDITSLTAVKPISMYFNSWIEVKTLESGWVVQGVANATVGYTKDKNGIVRLKGAISNGLTAQPIFYLPEGYRPLSNIFIPLSSENSIDEVFMLYIGASDGSVQIRTSKSTTDKRIHLENVNFIAK